MIVNELRTLLLNSSGANAPHPTYPGEEFVPPTFVAVRLPSQLAIVWHTIFGNSPDRALMNYRLRELMAIIHPSELVPFVYALDPRVTYWPPLNNSMFNSTVQGFLVTPLVGTGDLSVQGQTGIVTDSDILNYAFTITVTDSTHATVQQTAGGTASAEFSFTTTAGLSSPVPLPGTNVSVIFTPTVTNKWQVAWVATPIRELAAIDDNLHAIMTEEVRAALFGVNPVEPYLTFQNLWDDNILLPYRVAAVALALGYQTAALLG